MEPSSLQSQIFKFSMAVLRITLMSAIGLVIYFKLFEQCIIFFPEKTLSTFPRVPYEDVHFPALDGTQLHGWYIPVSGSKTVFVISHGNAGNISDRLELTESVAREFRMNVFIYDYRGYGQSAGRPSEAALYADIRGALAFVHSRGYSAHSVYLIGQSLGTAVTIDAASSEDVGGVILEAAFPNVRAVVRRYTRMPLDYLLSSQFDSLSKILHVHAPIAFVHATRDPVIPFDLGQELFQAAAGPKKFFSVIGEIHEGALMALGLEQTKQLRDFLVRPH